MRHDFSRFDQAFVAPCPFGGRVQEGWMSRIAAIDSVFSGKARLYVHFALHHTIDDGGAVHDRGGGLFEICLNAAEPAHQRVMDELMSRVRMLYVHTIHLAEFILPWLDSGKVVVDFHGVVPEEEIMLGRPELAGRYEEVERQVLARAMACVMVSGAMRDHYAEKYPLITPRRCIELPIVESLRPMQRAERGAEVPVNVVYAGGIQAWQNLDAMLSVCRSASGFARFRFLSHDHAAIRHRADELGVTRGMECFFCPKPGLPAEYALADFGFALRDDTAVNRVSSPTKVFEYLQCGIIPIVRSPYLGDFYQLGYQYITEDEFLSGFFPDSSSREWMLADNLRVAGLMCEKFRRGTVDLAAFAERGGYVGN